MRNMGITSKISTPVKSSGTIRMMKRDIKNTRSTVLHLWFPSFDILNLMCLYNKVVVSLRIFFTLCVV